MANLRYACTALAGVNKTGLLKPDEHGYYRMILGAFNFYNASGIFYDHESSKHVFESSSSFMRRITTGNLYGEREHPAWEKGWSLDEYVRRIRHVDGTNVSHHIREIEVEEHGLDSKGRMVYVVYGWIKPDRDHGAALQSALDNPHQNVCFSIRSLIDDKWIKGECVRTVTELVTYDWVTEPGISLATKYNNPGLECFDSLIMMPGEDIIVPDDTIYRLHAQELEKQRAGVGFESESLLGLEALIQHMEKTPYQIGKPQGLIAW